MLSIRDVLTISKGFVKDIFVYLLPARQCAFSRFLCFGLSIEIQMLIIEKQRLFEVETIHIKAVTRFGYHFALCKFFTHIDENCMRIATHMECFHIVLFSQLVWLLFSNKAYCHTIYQYSIQLIRIQNGCEWKYGNISRLTFAMAAGNCEWFAASAYVCLVIFILLSNDGAKLSLAFATHGMCRYSAAIMMIKAGHIITIRLL